MNRLIVKNFGPLKNIDIELNKINLFIGENGSGKSILAKLITIIFNFDKSTQESVIKKFNEYNINYILDKSIIEFRDTNEIFFKIENQKISFGKTYQKAILLAEKVYTKEKHFLEILNRIKEENSIEDIKKLLDQHNITDESLPSCYQFISQYIPAERNLISLFNKSLSTLVLEDMPLPKFLLQFSSEFEKAGNHLKELEFLNVKYINSDGLDRHKVYFNNTDYLPLEYSSSGIQSALPLYLTIKYFAQKHKDIIIEEPEQNLFPKAQKETIQYIIEQMSDKNNLFMMTHSPYILSTLNILIMAYKAGNLGKKAKSEVSELFNEKQWINPDNFSAYYLENGIARDIKGDMGLINNNEIDDISNNIQSDFKDLLSIYKEYKNYN